MWHFTFFLHAPTWFHWYVFVVCTSLLLKYHYILCISQKIKS
jgi:hypothetical protein